LRPAESFSPVRFKQASFPLQERLEDMEDLMELRDAVARNAGKPGIPWEQVKAELDIE
jgi:hypothetical protein